jgi:hypothetical protein
MIDEFFEYADTSRSLVRLSRLQIATKDCDPREKVTYLVTPVLQPGFVAPGDRRSLFMAEKQRVSGAIDDISRVEVYRHKIWRFSEDYPTIYAQVGRIEGECTKQMQDVSKELAKAKISDLKKTLYRISDRFVDIATLSQALRHDSYSTASNLGNLRTVFRLWGEEKVEGYPLASAMLLARIETVPEAYARLADRVEDVRVAMEGVTEVMRAKVDLEQQADILIIQRGVDLLQIIIFADIFIDASEKLGFLKEQPLILGLSSLVLSCAVWLVVRTLVGHSPRRR